MLRLVAGFLWLGLVITGLIAAMFLPLRKIWIPASLFLISGFALFLTQEPLSGAMFFDVMVGTTFLTVTMVPCFHALGIIRRKYRQFFRSKNRE